MKGWLILCAILAACSSPSVPIPPPPAVPPSPPPLTYCPPAPSPPALLPSVVTTERLQGAYAAVELARQAERRRGDFCADGLKRLQAWSKDQQL